jgi:hypothetical protein
MDLTTVRTALLITLTILLVVVLFRRFKASVLLNDVPAPAHAELLALEVAYHPSRLHVLLDLPKGELIRSALLDGAHNILQTWDDIPLPQGRHRLERILPPLADGSYFIEVSTTTQRTVRGFRLQLA